MLTLIRPYRLSLRYKFSAIFTIIIRPAMYFRNFSFPVTMPRIDWCCPFQCISTPRIGSSYFSSFENGVEEIEHKHQLHGKYYDGNYRNHFIQVPKLVERQPGAFIQVTAWYTCQ